MKISVIITTYQSPEWLEKVICGYLNQTHRDFELIVADDGSDAITAQVVEKYLGNGIPIKHVWQADKGFRKTKILNKAIVKAHYDYLVFSDGDCIPRKDFLSVHAADATKGRFLSGGYIKLPMSTSQAITLRDIQSNRSFSNVWLISNGIYNPKLLLKLLIPKYASPIANRLTPTKPTWNGHNSSGWKEDIIKTNGFDERMEYGGLDRELGERLENAGIKGKCIRYRAICIHLDHKRDYKRSKAMELNNKIRHQTRSKSKVKTNYGIIKF
ncbi:MAG: glycosyltransferase family 2 protein [Flavobacteriaceae bacterium]|nr:glycosyltransferase family 2 protein [Flavobacteriaceae bacterium]MCY4267365.1 glycosyltransferase family 2 protein [Flavobacteriaceae bacterium]MCY4299158.1 glycosyltransferase family 2 protein [Flavobacteriaceae bacterium]